jgi:hypothetical protein
MELWLPAEKITVTQTDYANGKSAVTFSGEFRRHEVGREPTGFASVPGASGERIATPLPQQRAPEA